MSNSIVFLPLSGGMDSRLLAWALKKYKIKNRIICFSYGVDSDVEEARISSQIANELGFEWEFIQYTKENWKNLRMKFGELSSKIVDVKSIIHLQDYLSVKYLTDKYGEGIFLPGLCFDVLAGYTIPDIFSFNNNIPIQNVLYEGFYKKDKIEEIINSELTRLNNYELFIKNSRLSSFIVNSIRIYENFGCEFYLPFWDLELVNFWYSIPLNDRINRNIFRSYINSFAYINEYSELLNIPVTGGRTQKDKYSIPNFLDKIDIFKRRYKNIIKKKIPISILNYIGKNIDYSKSDYLGFYNFIFSDLETRRLILKNDYLDFELINVTSYHYDSLLALITLAEMNIPISQEIIRKIYCNG